MIQRWLQKLRAVDWWREGPLLALFLAVAIACQWLSGAWQSEFGGHPDEAAHYVTGLMVRDYVAHGLTTAPMKFARDYYDHYPKVALGNWPPVFYLMQTVWTLPFGVSHTSLLLLMALLAALVARVIVFALEPEFGRRKAAAAAVLFLATPFTAMQTGMVMTEIPVTLFSLLAVLAFGRFLESERTRDAVAFGLLASLAIMTKGSGLALALVPGLGVLFTRRWSLLTRPAFWYPAILVAVLCGPWMYATLGMAKAGWEEGSPSLGFTVRAFPFYLQTAWLAVGGALLVLALAGIVDRLVNPATGKVTGLWAAVGAQFFGVWLFQSLVPCGLEERHFVPALAALVMFILAGAEWLARRAGQGNPAAQRFVYGAGFVFFLVTAFHIPRKDYQGFGPVAEQVLAGDKQNSVLFISSDAIGEGMFISEVAMHERRPGHQVVRASKLLASSSWGGRNYTAKAASPKDVWTALHDAKVGVVVVDKSLTTGRRQPHHELLEQTLRLMPDHFQLVQKSTVVRKGERVPEGIEVWRVM